LKIKEEKFKELKRELSNLQKSEKENSKRGESVQKDIEKQQNELKTMKSATK